MENIVIFVKSLYFYQVYRVLSRLGFRATRDVRTHAFFDHVDWRKILEKKFILLPNL